MTLGFGILSWLGYESLENSLSTYKEENFFSLFSESIIFLPQQRLEETELAQSFGLTVYGNENNLGILGGFKALAQSMTSDIILLVENDCPLIVDYENAKKQILYGQSLIETNKVDIVRFRSRTNPGQDWSINRKYSKLYPPAVDSSLKKLNALLFRLSRFYKLSSFDGWSIYINHEEARKFPHSINYDEENDCYFTDSSHLSWTNQSIMVKKSFFLEKIIAYAEAVPTKRRINGFRNLEIEMNSCYWRKNKFKIAIPQGIFTHHRIGERGYSIK